MCMYNFQKGDVERKEPEVACSVCKQKFQSRSKLFEHIEEKGHAMLVSEGASKSESRSKAKKGQRAKK